MSSISTDGLSAPPHVKSYGVLQAYMCFHWSKTCWDEWHTFWSWSPKGSVAVLMYTALPVGMMKPFVRDSSKEPKSLSPGRSSSRWKSKQTVQATRWLPMTRLFMPSYHTHGARAYTKLSWM